MSEQRNSREPKPLKICVLGRMVVQRPDGSIVNGPLWGRTKVRCLLALFVLHNPTMHREEIIRLLWPEIPRQAALANLNNTVYSLRRCLEPENRSGLASRYIHYQQGGYYALNDQSPFWLDKCSFLACVREARVANPAAEAKPLYEKAIDLYRGEYLDGLTPITPLFINERVHLRLLYFDALSELAVLHEREGQVDRAIALYLKILDVNPKSDSAIVSMLKLALNRNVSPLSLAYFESLREARGIKREIFEDLKSSS